MSTTPKSTKEYISCCIHFDRPLGSIAGLLTELASTNWEFTEMNRAVIKRDSEGQFIGVTLYLERDKQDD